MEKVLAACHLLFAFELEQYLFPKIVCKSSESCGRKAWNEIILLVLSFL